MVKLRRSNNMYSVTIPKDIILLLKWGAGDKITVTTDNTDIILKKIVEDTNEDVQHG